MVAFVWCSGSPSAAPSNTGLPGVFGHRLSEFRNKPRSMWLVRASFDGRPANRVAQDKSGSWGALSFGYLFFGQAKKSNSPNGEKNSHNKEQPFTAIESGLDSAPRPNDDTKKSPPRMMHLMQLLQPLPRHMRINLRR